MPNVLRRLGPASLIAGLTLATAGNGAAHPHIMIEAELVFEVRAGALVAIRQRWTFDEDYRKSTYEEFDRNRNGRLEPGELEAFKALARATMKQFNNFTTIQASKVKARTKPADFTAIDMTAAKPRIEFKLVLIEPLLVAPSIVIEVYDPTYYSAFHITTTSRLSIEADGRAACTATLTAPAKDGAQLAAYRAFAAEFGPLAARLVKPQSITLTCAAPGAETAAASDSRPAAAASTRGN